MRRPQPPALEARALKPGILRGAHDLPLIWTIAAAFFVAWLLGLLTQRLGLSPIVGYLLAGVVIGPSAPGFIGDLRVAQQLAEVGVILLMFGVGLHLDVKDLLAVRRVAITGAIGQSLVATLLGAALFTACGFPMKTGFVVGMALAVASTVVLIRMLEDRKLVDAPEGHIAVGWLVVEDIFTVIILVIIPIIGTSDGEVAAATPWDLALGIGWVFLKLAVMVAVVVFIGARAIPWVRVARSRSRELFTLTVLVFSITLAAGAYVVFGASMAIGAFLAGMMVAQSPSSHQVAADALPLRDAFAVLFFVSVGMLFDPAALISDPLLVLGGLAIVLIAKPLAALGLVMFLGYPTKTGLTVAVSLAQIGEFSFILSDAARKHGLMPQAGHNVLIATAIISITLNPVLFALAPRLEAFIQRRPRLSKALNRRSRGFARVGNIATTRRMTEAARSKKRLAVVVGYGPVGQAVDRLLREAEIETVVVDTNIETVIELQRQNRNAVFGDASRSHILDQAGIGRASHLVLAFPAAEERTAVISAARNLNPAVRILVRALPLRKAGSRSGRRVGVRVRRGRGRRGAGPARAHRHRSEPRSRRSFHPRSEAQADPREPRRHGRADRAERDGAVEPGAASLVVGNPRDRAEDGRQGTLLAVAGGGRRDRKADRIPPREGPHRQDERRRGVVLLVRPLLSVAPDEPIEPTLRLLQTEGATVCLVAESGRPVGLFTIEDILEQVVGRIEDEYPRRGQVSLKDAVARGGAVMNLAAQAAEEAIQELAAAIPPGRLPRDADVAERALAREREIHTDVGLGVALPHARCPGLPDPIVVFGRSTSGIVFNPESEEPVRLVFLILTPAEEPEVQIMLLAQLARIAGNASVREQLAAAPTADEILSILRRAESAERA